MVTKKLLGTCPTVAGFKMIIASWGFSSTTRKSERLAAANAAAAAAAFNPAAAAASPTATANDAPPPVILEGRFEEYMSPGYVEEMSREKRMHYQELCRRLQKNVKKAPSKTLLNGKTRRSINYQSTSCVGKRC
jgi:hypothetical protein